LGVESLSVPQAGLSSPATSRVEKIQRGDTRRIRRLGLPILLLVAAVATGARYVHARDRLTLAQAYSENVLTLVREHPEVLLMPACRLSMEKELAKAEAEWAAMHRELAPLWPLAALATEDAVIRPLREGFDQRVISALQAGDPAFRQARQALAVASRVRRGMVSWE